MRILKGQSNRNVSSNGFALLVVGLVGASFVGGALKTYLNSDAVHNRIVQQLKLSLPKNTVTVDRTRVRLARGVFPAIMIELNDLKISQRQCGKLSFESSVAKTLVPIKILNLLFGSFRLDDISVEDGDVELSYFSCSKDATLITTDTVTGETEAPSALGAPPRLPNLKIPALNLPGIQSILDGIKVTRLNLHWLGKTEWKWVVPAAEIRFGRGIWGRVQVEAQKSLPFSTATHSFELEMDVDEKLWVVNLQSELKEGRASLALRLDGSSQAAVVEASGRQIPVKDLFHELYRFGFVDQDFDLKSTWLSCSLKWEGYLDKVRDSGIQWKDCRVEGGYGRASLDYASLGVGDSGELNFSEPANIRIQNLQIQPFLESFRVSTFPAVFSQLGTWTGDLRFASSTKWSAKGSWESLDVIFVNQSLRGKQTLRKFNSEIRRNGDVLTLGLSDIDLEGGVAKGELSGEFDMTSKSGQLSLSFSELEFSSGIQSVLTGGKLGPIRLQGLGKFLSSDPVNIELTADCPFAEAASWRAEAIRAKLKYSAGVSTVQVTANQAVVKSSWPYYSQIHKVLAEPPDTMSWRDLGETLKVMSTGGSIEKLSASSSPIETEMLRWSADGKWRRDGDFSGHLNVRSAKKNRSFEVEARAGQLTVAPL